MTLTSEDGRLLDRLGGAGDGRGADGHDQLESGVALRIAVVSSNAFGSLVVAGRSAASVMPGYFGAAGLDLLYAKRSVGGRHGRGDMIAKHCPSPQDRAALSIQRLADAHEASPGLTKKSRGVVAPASASQVITLIPRRRALRSTDETGLAVPGGHRDDDRPRG